MRKADDLSPSCAVVMKSGNLNFLEPSGPLQAYNGTALPLPLPLLTCRLLHFRYLRYFITFSYIIILTSVEDSDISPRIEPQSGRFGKGKNGLLKLFFSSRRCKFTWPSGLRL